jgi:hypothetical protein
MARGVDEADVALDRVQPHALDAHRRLESGQRPQRDKVRGRRGVGLDVDGSGRLVLRAARQREARIRVGRVALDDDAEARQQVQRDVDVRLGDQLALDGDRDRALAGGQRQGQQQRGEELARHVPAHAHRLVRGHVPGPAVADAQRRVAGVAQVLHRAAELAQRVDQVADGTLVHACHAGQLELAALQGREHGERGAERTHRRPRVAEEQARLPVREPSADAGDVQHGAVAAQAAAQRRQRGQHHAGVVGVEQVVHRRRALGQAGQQQHPVGDALGAGQPHAAGGRTQGRDVEEGDRVHGRELRVFSASVEPEERAAGPRHFFQLARPAAASLMRLSITSALPSRMADSNL